MDVAKLPITSSQRRKNKLGKYSVDCFVTSRWLKFSEKSSFCGNSEIFHVDVMTDSGEKERKICDLMIEKKDLLRALKNIK